MSDSNELETTISLNFAAGVRAAFILPIANELLVLKPVALGALFVVVVIPLVKSSVTWDPLANRDVPVVDIREFKSCNVFAALV